MDKKTNIIVFFILAFLVGISCYGIFSLNFLNDEWLQLGYVTGKGIFALYADKLTVLDILLGKGRFLGGIINNIFLYFFQDSPSPFAVFGFVFHLINSYLVYILTKEMTGKKMIAFITACVFSVPSTAHQAVSWLAATTQTLGGMTFVFLSLITGIKGLKKNNIGITFASWVLAYIAFLFKESSFFVFPLLFFLPLLIPNKRKNYFNIRYMTLFIPLIIFGLYKMIEFFNAPTGTLFSTSSLAYIGKSFVNMVFYPLVTLGHFFIPFRFMLRLSITFGSYYYSFLAGATESNRAASVIVADLLSIIISFAIVLAVFYIFLRRKQFQKSLWLAFFWYVLSFIPMAVFLPERNTSYLESRYLYFSYFPVAYIISLLMLEVKAIVETKFKNIKIAWGVLVIILSLFLWKQIVLMQREIQQNIVYGNDIVNSMKAIHSLYPSLPDKPIFLVEGDRNYYYAKINLPYQVGVGYMMALTFRDSPMIPKEIMTLSYFSKYSDYGYKEFGEKAFGFFGNREDLLNFFRNNPDVSTDQVVALYYHGYTGELIDQTEIVRKFIETNKNI